MSISSLELFWKVPAVAGMSPFCLGFALLASTARVAITMSAMEKALFLIMLLLIQNFNKDHRT